MIIQQKVVTGMVDKETISHDRQPYAGARTEEVATIPLVEEYVTVAKRQVESSRVRVHVQVDERQEVVSEHLHRDDVEVERISRNEILSAMPNVRLEGGTTIVPVVEEVLVVEKRLMLVEEIHIRRRSEVEQRDIPVTLRRERARVEHTDVPAAGLDMSGTTTGKPQL